MITHSKSAKTNRLVGAALRRVEDPRFLMGRGSYVDDLRRPGMLHAAFFRSDIPHGKLNSVDVSKARDVPGVIAVLTAQDIAPMLKPLIARNDLDSFHEFGNPNSRQRQSHLRRATRCDRNCGDAPRCRGQR